MKPLLLALVLTSHVSHAETLRIPIGSQSGTLDLPTLGQSRSLVIERFGLPSKEHAPVGQPPITRWDYPTFSVYFEYQHVLKSVVHPPHGNMND